MSTATATVAYENKYGATQTNGLVDGAAYHNEVDYSKTYSLKQIADMGGKVTRLRLIGERRGLDVSYIIANLPNGKMVPVYNGMNSMMPLWTIKGEIIAWAKREGVFAKSLGLLDEGNWSVAI